MPSPRLKCLISIAVVAAALPLNSGSARGQTPEASVNHAEDAGARNDGSAPPPAAMPPAIPSDAGPASPPVLSPEPASTAAPAPVMDVAPEPPPITKAPPPSFGRRGQVAVLGGSSFGLSSSSFDGSSATRSSYTFSPEIDYFIARNVSIGIATNVSYDESKGYGADGSLVDTRTTTLSAGPRFGLNIPLGGVLSWYPQATLGLEWTRTTEHLVAGESLSTTGAALGYPSTTQFGPYVDIYAPLLLHATDHFFFGFGPGFFHDFGTASGGPSIGGQRTQITAGFVVGGYWGGESAPSVATAHSTLPAASARRFGDEGEVVVTNDLVLSASSLTYAGNDSTRRSAAIGGSIDYFAIDHVSFGIAASLDTSYFKGIDASTRAAVTTSVGGVNIAPRLGVNFAIGGAVSLYPLVEVGFGHQSYDEASGPSENKSAADIISVGLFAPLLVHPAPHLFVGFGPSVYQEISHAVTFAADPGAPAVQNREMTLGAGLIVGGWL